MSDKIRNQTEMLIETARSRNRNKKNKNVLVCDATQVSCMQHGVALTESKSVSNCDDRVIEKECSGKNTRSNDLVNNARSIDLVLSIWSTRDRSGICRS